jgi:hypothetical protein
LLEIVAKLLSGTRILGFEISGLGFYCIYGIRESVILKPPLP